MRTTFGLLGLALAFGIAAGQTVNVPRMTAPGTNSPYDYAYNVSSQVTVSGTIVGIGDSKPNHTMPTNRRLIIQTPGKHPTTYLVELGPKWFVSDQVTKPKLGQSVKVTGSKITEHGQTKILARTVQLHNHDVLALRRANGDPYWVDLRAATETVAQNSTPAPGTILNSMTFNINGVYYPGYIVQTTNGPQNVVLMGSDAPNNAGTQGVQLPNGVMAYGAGVYPVAVTGGPAISTAHSIPSANPGVPGGQGVFLFGPHW